VAEKMQTDEYDADKKPNPVLCKPLHFLIPFFRLMIIFINDQSDIPVVDMKQRRKRKKTVTVFGMSRILSGVLDV